MRRSTLSHGFSKSSMHLNFGGIVLVQVQIKHWKFNKNSNGIMKKLSWVKCYCLFFYFQRIVVTHALKSIINDLNPFQVAVFTNYEKNKISKIDYLYQGLVGNFPTVTIDLLKMEQSGENRILGMKIFHKPRQSSIYVILQGSSNEKFTPMKSNDVLDKLVTISPVAVRPKSLLVFYGPDVNSVQSKAEEILKYAWSLKFLDFTILIIDDTHKNGSTYINYNPFMKKFNSGYLKNKTNLFPDKLTDVNRYPLNLLVYNLEPYLIVKVENGSVKDVVGNTPFIYLKTISKYLNFELNYKFSEKPLIQAYVDASDSVANDEANVTPIAYHFSYHVLNELDILLGNVMEMSYLVVIVPILPEYAVDIPLSALIYLITFSFITIIFVALLRIFKIKSNEWDFVSVIQILIGVSISQPVRNVDRVIFLSIVILSIIYTNELFSQLTDIKVTVKEKEFNTFEEVCNSGMTIYSTLATAHWESEEINKLISISKKSLNFFACFDELIKTNNVICVAPLRSAIYGTKQNLNSQGNPVMKVTDLSFGYEYIGFLYEKASPFAEKFDKLMQRMVEFSVFPDREMNKVKLYDSVDESAESDDTIEKTTLLILLIGCFLSMITFTYELISYSLNNRRKKNVRKNKRNKNLTNRRKEGCLVEVKQRENSVIYEIIDYFSET